MAEGQKTVALFGATGSIGSSTLDLVLRHPERFRVSILTGGRNVKLLSQLALRFRPDHVAIADEKLLPELRDNLASEGATEGASEGASEGIEVHGGDAAIADLARIDADLTVAAITGMAGLMPVLNAVERGGVIAIANKESIVTAGALILEAAKKSGAVLLPMDSEHNAIMQAMVGQKPESIDRIILTASGGPFWDWSGEQMQSATPQQAVNHPNWSMGAKISVDSATMMNKGLEVIEAGVLFDLPEDRIRVMIHRQSLVHGIVCYRDGSMLAQMGDADMRVPISHCLAWPDRLDWQPEPLSLDALASMTFEQPDPDRFPCLELAREAMRTGGLAPTSLNAANEVAVEHFLNGSIGFLDIAGLNRHILDTIDHPASLALDAIISHDRMVRKSCHEWLAQQHGINR